MGSSPSAATGLTRGSNNSAPPVILLGGEYNVISIARSLSKEGVRVFAINHPEVASLRSRYVTRVEVPGDNHSVDNWCRYLLAPASDHLKGAALFCCSDEAIKLVSENWKALSLRYILEPCPPDTRLVLLDKLSTYESASACGIAHPRFWRIEVGQGVDEVAQACLFPVILKPRLSQHWRLLGARYLRADTPQQLRLHYRRCVDLNIPVVAMEFILGGDDRYCSYYTYIDETGYPLFHFTKRLLRRHPTNDGGATYHITDWNPEVAAKGLRLFRHVGLRGLGNVEFKRDPRDGELKIIDVNARYTGGNALVTRSGIDLALLSYAQLTGRSYSIPETYGLDLVMWDPVPDFFAFCRLNADGALTLTQWLRQAIRADVTPNFNWRDPLPLLHYLAATAQFGARKIMSRHRPIREPALEAPAALSSEID